MNDDRNQPTPPPADTGPVRVYDRPEVPPSVARRRRLTLIFAVIGVLIALLLLWRGPLRNALAPSETRVEWRYEAAANCANRDELIEWTDALLNSSQFA